MSDDLFHLSTFQVGSYIFVCAAKRLPEGYQPVAMCRTREAAGVTHVPIDPQAFKSAQDAVGRAQFLATEWALTKQRHI